MIATATARRRVGDWAGACAAAGVDLDIDLRALARARGTAVAAAVRADLRHLAPDLLRWHLPRVAPDGLLRPGLTMTLARYDTGEIPGGGGESLHLVIRTPPAWAAGGQRIALTLWDGSALGSATRHPHPRPHRRYRLDLHRHLWDARRAHELRTRSGAPQFITGAPPSPSLPITVAPDCAVHRWAAEIALLLRAEHPRPDGTSPKGAARHGDTARTVPADHRSARVLVRCGARRRLILTLDPVADLEPGLRAGAAVDVEPGLHSGPTEDPEHTLRLVTTHPRGAISALPVLPDAATWTLPDLELLRSGAISLDRLHPLVAAALAPVAALGAAPAPGAPIDTADTAGAGVPDGRDRVAVTGSALARGESAAPWPDRADTAPGLGAEPVRDGVGPPEQVWCRGEVHRIGLVDGVLTALDHDPAEIRREELLAALTGTPLPCLRAIELAHRHPDRLAGVLERLDHGDIAGAVATVSRMLGPAAVLRDGPLRDALETCARRQLTYRLFRAGLAAPGTGPDRPVHRPRRVAGDHPRLARATAIRPDRAR